MTDAEKTIIHDETYEGLKKLAAEDIGELMNHAAKIPGSGKIGNVLYDAITRAFVLGYYRARNN